MSKGKDPAFLFYSSDFLTGTLTMTNEQVGKYIRLMCLQHQKWELSEKDMLFICDSYDKDIWNKFITDEDGSYFNERLRDEMIRRSEYSESRRKNRLGKGKEVKSKEKKGDNISLTYDKHMETETETETITNTIPDINLFIEYAVEKKSNVDIEAVKLKYESWKVNDWKDGYDKPIKNWKTKLLNTLPHMKENNPTDLDSFKQRNRLVR